MSELEFLHKKHKRIVINYCNEIGCKDCPKKIEGGECEAEKLYEKILELENKEATK